MDHIHTFLTTQGHGRPSRMSDQSNAGATSETAQTWKTTHTKHTFSHPNKANMEWWLRRPNYIRGYWGPKVFWHLSYRWAKTPKNLTQETCPDRGSNPGPLPLAPQRWTQFDSITSKFDSVAYFATDLHNWAQIVPYIRNYQHQDYQSTYLFICWILTVFPLFLSNPCK